MIRLVSLVALLALGFLPPCSAAQRPARKPWTAARPKAADKSKTTDTVLVFFTPGDSGVWRVWNEALVDVRPEVLSGPPLAYPDLLRQAGVQGRVVVQTIIDTMGRAEPASVKIVRSPHEGFNEPVTNYILGARFRPARVRGRAVRVLVNLPIDFHVRRQAAP